MIRSTPSARRIARRFLWPFEAVAITLVNVSILFRLGNMQLEGIPTFLGAMLALLAATTSLLFNRARAYPSGPLQRRSLLAAELSLRATLLAALGAAVAAVIWPLLVSAGYVPTPMDKFPTQWVPMLLAFLPALFFIAASLELIQAGRVLAPTFFIFLRARHIRCAVR